MESVNNCPAESLLKMLSGKWKMQIFRLAVDGPVRFNSLVRHLEGSNKQSISVALKEMEESEILSKRIVSTKPMHIEYDLSEKGRSLIGVFMQIENLL